MKAVSFPAGKASFSLIEVLLALGIISFALLSVMGLLTVGLKTSKESSNQIEAANLASLLISTRRAMPTNTIEYAPIPSLANGVSTPYSNSAPIQVGIGGTTNTTGMEASDLYNLDYAIYPGATTNLVTLHLLLWWPVQLKTPPTNNPGSYYEITTDINF